VRLELPDRDEDLCDITLLVGLRTGRAPAEQPRNFPHRLASALIRDSVDDNECDALGRAQLFCQ
jgi:hypothetical protein